MHYVIFWPTAREMEKAGFGYISEVPVIFDENWKYHREASWYLRDRNKGEALSHDTNMRAFPARSSLGQYGYKLTDFLAWCDWVKRSWKAVEYHRDLISRYQKHMLDGDWSANRGQKLRPSTVNGRVDEAVYFCKWAAKHGLREPFNVQTRTVDRKAGGIRSDSHKSNATESRVGKARPKPIRLRMPEPKKIEQWLKQFAIERGPTKALMADLILRTAIRREEAAQWRTSYLPKDRAKWDITGEYVQVYLEFGCKGNKPRYIDVPLEMAERLAHYEKTTREKNRMIYVKAGRTAEECKLRMREKEDRLFLSDFIGKPVSPTKLYEAWTEISVQPIEHWSVHLGRHYWACMTLLNIHRRRVAQLTSGAVATPDWAMALGRDDLLIHITPQLGHIDKATSEAYIVWLGKMVRAAEHSQQWIDSLETDRTNDNENNDNENNEEM